MDLEQAEVRGPNPQPTGDDFLTSTENYADGYPEVPPRAPGARQARQQRLAEQAVTNTVSVKNGL